MNFATNHPFHLTDRILRQFSVIWILFFGAIAARQEFQHQHHILALVLAILALTLGPLGVVWPRAIKPIFVGWMALAYPIGWLVSRLVLGILFYGLFTPVAWFFRMTGRDVLRLKPLQQTPTYWCPKPRAPDKSHYFRQS